MTVEASLKKIQEVADRHGQRLVLAGMALTELPSEVWHQTQLFRLELQNNNLTSLPPEIGRLTNLVSLSIHNNQLTTLPPEITSLPNLRWLGLANNQLTELPSEIRQLTKLEEIDLNNNLLTTLPPEIGELTRLLQLKLQNNRLSALPPEIQRLTNLEVLSLSNNLLTALPPAIGQLTNLKWLPLNDNRLTELPPDIGQLTKLSELKLQNNRLRTLPSEIGCLTGLKYIHLQNNQLSALPAEIGKLANLEMLYLQNNELSELPPEIKKLEKLTKLYIHVDQPTPLPLVLRIKKWDVFISHASEDKEAVAAPLAEALKRAGLKVWIDKHELKLGDSLREKIDTGLAESRFGVVILSQSYLDKVWTKRELNGLMAVEEDGQKVILPIWHNISKVILAQHSPILADRLAADTKEGILHVASQLIDVVLYRASGSPATLFPSLTRRLVEHLMSSESQFTLRDFLIQHPRIIGRAYGKHANDNPHLIPGELNDSVPSILAIIEHRRTDGSSRDIYLVLESPKAQFFEVDGSPSHAIASCVSQLSSAITKFSRDECVIVAGRRHELDYATRKRLGDYNNHISTTRIQIRTYDWLIDACASVEQEFSKF